MIQYDLRRYSYRLGEQSSNSPILAFHSVIVQSARHVINALDVQFKDMLSKHGLVVT